MKLEGMNFDVVQIRRQLHQIPEIAFDVFKTQAFLQDQLMNYGYHCEVVAKTGLVAVKKGKGDTSVAFRADMDALMVTEMTGVDYASTHEGKMHACGHDGHMTMVLGFAKYVSELENLNKSIVFIFQPAEEGPGGAKLIVDEGILKKFQVEAIFGIHLFPGLSEGLIGLRSGAMMAQPGEINVTIQARSAHGAEPHKGNDAIYVASQLIQSYQSIVSRKLDPLEPAVVTIGKIVGGEARNIIAGSAKLEGTIRAFSPNIYNQIKEEIMQINKGFEVVHGVSIDTNIVDQYPPVINDDNLFQLLLETFSKDEYEMIKPMMLAEDFAYYQQAVPGFFMLLGSRNESLGFTHPLHSCYFNYNESILLKGIEAYVRICRQMHVFGT